MDNTQVLVRDQSFIETNLIIESITLLDGVTPDPDVQYKVGRHVEKVVKEKFWNVVDVFYDDSRYWRTYAITNIEYTTDKLILTDKKSIYTLIKQ